MKLTFELIDFDDGKNKIEENNSDNTDSGDKDNHLDIEKDSKADLDREKSDINETSAVRKLTLRDSDLYSDLVSCEIMIIVIIVIIVVTVIKMIKRVTCVI